MARENYNGIFGSRESGGGIAGVIGTVVGGILVLALHGCSDSPRNYDGVGNGFEVRGIVLDVQDDGTVLISEDQLAIKAVQGVASTWFKDGKGQNTFSDDFYFEPSYMQEEQGFLSDCEHEVTVGQAFDVEGFEIPVGDIQPGQTVIIDGSIRESSKRKRSGKISYCGTDERPVYDKVTVTNTPFNQS